MMPWLCGIGRKWWLGFKDLVLDKFSLLLGIENGG